MDLKNIKNRLSVAVRYDDLDTYNHVNNKVFLSYLEEARIFYMKDVSGFVPKNNDFQAVVGRIDIKYIVPLLLYDDVWVYSRCSKIGKKSFDIEHFVIKKVGQKEIVSAIATVTLVSYDLQNGKSKPNSEKMIQKIMDYENIKPEIN